MNLHGLSQSLWCYTLKRGQYSRVEYFYRRVADIFPRFQRIEGALPVCCRSKALLSQLEKLVISMSQTVKIFVVSKQDTSFEIHGAVKCQSDIGESFSRDTNDSENRINIFIFVTDVSDGQELEKVLGSIKEQFSISGLQNALRPNNSLLFVGKDSGSVAAKPTADTFRAKVQSVFRQILGCDIEQENIILEHPDLGISQHISDTLENTLIEDGFVAIKVFLQNFVRKTQTVRVELPGLSEEESVTDAVKSFLRNSAALADVSRSDNEDFIKVTIEHLSKIVKCTAAPYLARKHNVPDSICSDMLDEIEFTDHLTKAVKTNSVHYLTELKELLDRNATGNEQAQKFTYSSDILASLLMSDWKNELDRVDKISANMSRLISVMKKMIFEIEGYLKQSKRYKDMSIEDASSSQYLKRKVLEIDDVYGVGTIYGQLEIHIKQKQAREAVVDLLQKFNYSLPYSIKLVETR